MKVNVRSRARSTQGRSSTKEPILVIASSHRQIVPSPVVVKTVRKRPSIGPSDRALSLQASNVAAVVKANDPRLQIVPQTSGASAVTRIETVQTHRGPIQIRSNSSDTNEYPKVEARSLSIQPKGPIDADPPLATPPALPTTTVGVARVRRSSTSLGPGPMRFF